MILWNLWIGKARHPGPASLPRHGGVEVLNVGGWLTHGDLALEVDVDFLAVVEHWLILCQGLGVSGLGLIEGKGFALQLGSSLPEIFPCW